MLLKEAIAKENIGEPGVFYLNKNRVQTLLSGRRHQLPATVLEALNSNGIVHQVDEVVNRKIENITQSRQFRRWFKESAAVNPDGTPMQLYHQTEEDFTKFEVGRKGAGYYDNEMPSGIYMKPTADTLSQRKERHGVPLFFV